MDSSSYKFHRIPKRDGTMRMIAEPEPELKQKQQGILRWLTARGIRPSSYAHGFVTGRSTATHTRLHVGRKVVIKLDLKDFFGSTKAPQVITALMNAGLPAQTAKDIASTCTLDGYLPQGAPTSPFLANIAVKGMDVRLAALAKKYDATYSRYADDLCFSSDNVKLNEMLPAVNFVVKQCDYRLNDKKTRVMRRGRRQIVTGIVVNRKVNIPRKLRRNIRAGLHNVKMALVNNQPFDEKQYESLKGMAAYFQSVNLEATRSFKQDIKEIERLLAVRSANMQTMIAA
ncbi:MAG: reverse transcriptase family protein [Victivallales bacterium]